MEITGFLGDSEIPYTTTPRIDVGCSYIRLLCGRMRGLGFWIGMRSRVLVLSDAQKCIMLLNVQPFQERDPSLQCYLPLTLSKRLPLAVQGRINSSFLTRLYVYKCVAEVFCFKNLIAFMNRLLYEGHKIESFHVFHRF